MIYIYYTNLSICEDNGGMGQRGKQIQHGVVQLSAVHRVVKVHQPRVTNQFTERATLISQGNRYH